MTEDYEYLLLADVWSYHEATCVLCGVSTGQIQSYRLEDESGVFVSFKKVNDKIQRRFEQIGGLLLRAIEAGKLRPHDMDEPYKLDYCTREWEYFNGECRFYPEEIVEWAKTKKGLDLPEALIASPLAKRSESFTRPKAGKGEATADEKGERGAHHAKKREQILGAAIYMLRWHCNKEHGRLSGSSIATAIDQRADKFWPTTKTCPLAVTTMTTLINKYLKNEATFPNLDLVDD